METSEILEMLPSLSIARLFYAYGLLDKLAEQGYREVGCDYYEMFYEMLGVAADFISLYYNETYDYNVWYFSYDDMMEYYRLCRKYSTVHRVKLKDNPYMKAAEQFVENTMDFGPQNYGYGWHLQTKVNHKWASGIVFKCDCYFTGEFEVLEAMLALRQWFSFNVKKLRADLGMKEEPFEIMQETEAKAA